MVIAQSASSSKTTMQLSLKKTIAIAHEQAPEKLAAKLKLKSHYWQYRSYKAKYLPELSLDTDIFDYNRSITAVTLPSGREIYPSIQRASSSLSMALNQNIGLSGAQLFIRSQLERIDYQVDTSVISYLSNPILIGFRQPLFGFNSYRWEKKIEPLIYEESRRQYLEDLEEVSINAVAHFFDLYLAKIVLEISIINQANNDTLYKIARGRYNLGKIAENELLQMELSLLNSNIKLAEARLNEEVETFNLKNFLGIKDNIVFNLIVPDRIPEFEVDVNKAIAEASKDRQKIIEFERKLLEADRNVAKAKGENRFHADIVGSYGLNKSATLLSESFESPNERQQITLGIQLPILDWGRGKGVVKMAIATRDLIKTNIDQERVAFEQEIFLNVMKFNMQPIQLRITKKADTIALKRYFVTKQRYLIGKIDITELNIALQEKDEARRGYVEALRKYWSDYYRIRKLTLYDFERDKVIEFDDQAYKN